jgi:hypothetical protein
MGAYISGGQYRYANLVPGPSVHLDVPAMLAPLLWQFAGSMPRSLWGITVTGISLGPETVTVTGHSHRSQDTQQINKTTHNTTAKPQDRPKTKTKILDLPLELSIGPKFVESPPPTPAPLRK